MIMSTINILLTIKLIISLSLGQKYFTAAKIKIGLKKGFKIKIKLKSTRNILNICL